mmetsp:Transcript_16225/g.27758  ORF Transcript_16225/g.27758 Transcript_16225/m.27758 type:complete len:203 (-) Transcript_16225:44-652(-)
MIKFSFVDCDMVDWRGLWRWRWCDCGDGPVQFSNTLLHKSLMVNVVVRVQHHRFVCVIQRTIHQPITIELQQSGRLSLIVDVNNRREKQASKLVGITARLDNTVARSSEKRYISVVVVACMRHDVVARAFLEALFVWQAHVHLVIVCGHHAHRRRRRRRRRISAGPRGRAKLREALCAAVERQCIWLSKHHCLALLVITRHC